MKRTFLLMTIAIAMVMGAKAQQQTATLQQGASMKVYYGEDAFKEAYNNAQNGAKIILSAGYFNQVDSITKSISIIGNGGLLANNCTSFSNVYRKNENFPGITGNSIKSKMLVNANNVSVEGIYMDDAVILRNISGLHLTRCYIGQLFCTSVHTNTIIDQCYLKADCSEKESNNCCIKNSFVEGFNVIGQNAYDFSGWVSSSLTILNSVVIRYYYLIRYYEGTKLLSMLYESAMSATVRNSIIGSFTYKEPRNNYLWNDYYLYAWSGTNTGVIGSSNNLLFLYPYHYNGDGYDLVEYLKSYTAHHKEGDGNTSAAYDAIFNEDVPWYDPNYIKTTVTGDDGKVVGPYGGTGFSLYPSIPRITESKIDTYTNGEGKLNVKVKVEVGQ